ncbi:MAG TPA: hypothetical protein VFX59_13850 [Polyangiales bacterium]|nr:hypothetical protein [Polyangiales bacterium]
MREVEVQAEHAHLSRSEWLAQAARRTLDQAIVVRAMDTLLAEAGGPSTAAEITRARRKLGLTPRNRAAR